MKNIEQPEVEVIDTHFPHKSWGKKKIIQVNWNNRGQIECILVDFMGNNSSVDLMPMYSSLTEDAIFLNIHKNLTVKLEK